MKKIINLTGKTVAIYMSDTDKRIYPRTINKKAMTLKEQCGNGNIDGVPVRMFTSMIVVHVPNRIEGVFLIVPEEVLDLLSHTRNDLISVDNTLAVTDREGYVIGYRGFIS